jgi:hypothetical protein
MGLYEKIVKAMQDQQKGAINAKNVQIERQDAGVEAQETPEQTAARVQAEQSQAPAQSYVESNFERPAPKPDKPAFEQQIGNKPKTRAGWYK